MQDEIIRCLGKDEQLGILVKTNPFPSLRPLSDNLFEDLLRAIIGQQLSVKAAQTIFSRFLELFPAQIPDARLLPGLPDSVLRDIGLSRQKTAYVRNAAAFFLEIPADALPWHARSDVSIIEELTKIKGVGLWTVQMLLMFSLGRPDVFPVADLGIQTAMRRLYGLEKQGKELQEAMISIAERWRPYRSYACFYLWNWKDMP